MKSLNKKSKPLNKTNFGATIRGLRKSYGWRAYELAKKVGVNPVYITQIEKHNKLPSIHVMKKIFDALHSPELLEDYIKIKYLSFCKRRGKNKNISDVQENTVAYLKKGLVSHIGKEYLLGVRIGEGDIIKKIFGNDLGYNEISVSFKNRIKGIDFDPKIAKVDELGIVIATDAPNLGDPPNFGYHNYFIPWSGINYIYQYIST